jgi:hypothetical protein
MGYLCPFETGSLFYCNGIERFHLVENVSLISFTINNVHFIIHKGL